ncbi:MULTISPECIES: hypothetical protein [unclassified Pseudoalteromonas]|uniref:hypothetical protein n=1 Tax=unclassified Pseudoalteromonas TaxID=194690 RepID=UPI00110AB07A|nr:MULTISPECIES: hypothetical protein [unclassified Pseudoalteromonas]TMP41395.1 hypothetical protein CWB80_21055 [Pseudoalteromonas sp. S1650]TMP64441.1 hypothetical protein CWB79_20695 [Pseudoalteromonas sp. S1649]
MLIYVNQFELIGPHSFSAAISTISGWLKQVTKKHFTNDMLLSGDEFTIDKMKVRTFTATAMTPALYSILLSHPDKSVKGRQWITEIGVKFEGNSTTISILLETSDISTLVKDIPSTTRPKLVSYLLQNATLNPESTLGLHTQTITNNYDSFKAFCYEIERSDRNFPLVFVSNCKTNKAPIVNPYKLQEQLVGLAQVIHSEEEIDSWELEKVLTRKYSAWDGAVNIIYPSFGREYCGNRLIRSDTLSSLNDKYENKFQHILSYITHTTNGYNKKRHFSPTDVRAKRQKDSRIQLKERFNELNSDGEYKSLAEEAFEQLEEQESVFAQLKEKYEREADDQLLANLEANQELTQCKNDKRVLEIRLNDFMDKPFKQGKPILIFGDESEKYEGEISELVIDALNNYIKNSKQTSRKYHLLQDILNNNPIEAARPVVFDELKQIFNNYNGMTSPMKQALKCIGLEVIQDGNHNHLRFINDDRCKVTFAKTPSDRRASGNIVRDIKAELF